METFDFNQGWPCFQNMPLEEAEIKEVNDSILEMRPSLYIMQRIQKWTEKFFQPSIADYGDGEKLLKKLNEWEVQTNFGHEGFERLYCSEPFEQKKNMPRK
ncbi:hypothetical protein [uncultured Methanobacterium sp.]|uniref:hypothetical protein n=1 Tax=uncultured Methanobacterium sp. TaxID=176306 RepID=UPI002AA839D3|nr:hypothetical protein [uncultured Methanobacterium sp.]